jgi:hypothetical protein
MGGPVEDCTAHVPVEVVIARCPHLRGQGHRGEQVAAKEDDIG